MRSVSSEARLDDHPKLGQTLRNAYRLVQLLDGGGRGCVFVAEQEQLGRQLAVKLWATDVSKSWHALADFHRAAAALAHLEHPNIVEVLDYDTTEEGAPYLVMELLRGESLSAKLAREGRLGLGVVARIVQQVAQGLACAHRAAITHRDLTPARVFLCGEGEAPNLKLLDFGIGLRSAADPTSTGEHAGLGTREYQAPEQALGQTDHRADQYSLAVIAYEALAATKPFPNPSLADAVSAPATPIHELAPHVPRAVWLVLERAFSKEPGQRYESVLEFSQAFCFAAGEALPTSQAPFAPSRSRFPSEDPRSGATRHPLSDLEPAPSNDDLHMAATRPTDPAPSARLAELRSFIARAREAFGLGDANLATSYVERAMQLADENFSRAEKLAVSSESSLIESVLWSRVAAERQRFLVRHADATRGDAALRPEQAFLLSRLDHPATLEELLDLSPLPRYETLRHVVRLLENGLLGFE